MRLLAAIALLSAWSCAYPPLVDSGDDCGNGVLEAGEECDDGAVNANVADACRTNCLLPTCGDNILDTTEECDFSVPGAAFTCGFDCRLLSSCGNNEVDPGESCDDGEANSNVVAGACRTDCQPARCGDGVLDPGEACDGKPVNGAACDFACRLVGAGAMLGAACDTLHAVDGTLGCVNTGHDVPHWMPACVTSDECLPTQACAASPAGSFCVPYRCGAGATGGSTVPYGPCGPGATCLPTLDPIAPFDTGVVLCHRPGAGTEGSACHVDGQELCAAGLACRAPPLSASVPCEADVDCAGFDVIAVCGRTWGRCVAVGACAESCDPEGGRSSEASSCARSLASCRRTSSVPALGFCEDDTPLDGARCLELGASAAGLTCSIDGDGLSRWLRPCSGASDCRAYERCEFTVPGVACVRNRCGTAETGSAFAGCSSDGALVSGATPDGTCLFEPASAAPVCWRAGALVEGAACRLDAASSADTCGTGLMCDARMQIEGKACAVDADCPAWRDERGANHAGYCDGLLKRCAAAGACRRPCDVRDPSGGGCALDEACVPAGVDSAAIGLGFCRQEGTGADPYFALQWHLDATDANGGTAGEDLHVLEGWGSGARGEGTTIAVVDDGLEVGHEDLVANVVPGLSFDYVTGGTDPTGGDHGTSVGGVAAARDFNGHGGRGVAPRAGLVGFNVLANDQTVNEADAASRRLDVVDVYNNSWGPPDGYAQLIASERSWRLSIERGLAQGRGGLGAIYTWAAGNGGEYAEDSNYDGYANFRGVMAIGAVGSNGRRAAYSEPGANVWVCTPSSGAGPEIFTTDRTGADGYNDGRTASEPSNADYTNSFGGTSSATPAAAGSAALVLAANSALTWRDVRRIFAVTARKNDPSGWHWSTNGAGHRVSSDCGFGVIDATAAVAAARTWTNLPPARAHSTPTLRPARAIPDDNATGVKVSTNVTGSGLAHIEWVEVYFDSEHTYAGDLRITLRNENTGTESVLATPHQCSGACAPFDAWRFGSARHLDESADGTWSLVVADEGPKDLGTIRSWRLVFHGHGER